MAPSRPHLRLRRLHPGTQDLCRRPQNLLGMRIHPRCGDTGFALRHCKAESTRYVPILPALAQELRTHLNGRRRGYLFETNRNNRYSVRTVQAVVKAGALAAGIGKRVYPHLLRHSVATILLDSGQVPIDQVQKFLGHLQLSTTQIYAETSIRALGDNYVRALGGAHA